MGLVLKGITHDISSRAGDEARKWVPEPFPVPVHGWAGATFWAEAKLGIAFSLCKVALEQAADFPANDAW